MDIKAERQWLLPVKKQKYYLDFAVFCNKGFIDIEADGDTWHARKDRIDQDNTRNNAMVPMGWDVLRYNGRQIRERMQIDCLPEIKESINKLDGLSDDGLVPRVFYQEGENIIQQLSLFEKKAEYITGGMYSGAEENLEE